VVCFVTLSRKFYFKIYFHSKDHIAIPDFAAGAMVFVYYKHWGLITYRESILFYDPLTSSNSAREFTVIVIAHELAHQWFGNLVTMKW
jgi:tricorn protease interacting factor F2/3